MILRFYNVVEAIGYNYRDNICSSDTGKSLDLHDVHHGTTEDEVTPQAKQDGGFIGQEKKERQVPGFWSR